MKKFLSKIAVAATVAGSALPCLAEDTGSYEITIPNGCNIGSWLSNGIIQLGTIAAIAIGGYFTFKLIVYGLGKFSKIAFGGSR